ncbi:Fic family protein [Amycolatopsis anabasis]|uniref:Fic family protein n=1 Tax=Amycolatopsis anabasis TaxID=1840409 RepID=UPI00131A8F55|nr:Fic/DOC family N-terminal domain-containing protein [Amycolatopsis anabasis]
MPRPLPSDLPLRSRTHRALAAAEQALGRLDEAAQRLPDRRVLVRDTMLREAQSSAALESTNLSLREVLLAQLPGAKPAPAIEPLLRYLEAGERAFAAMREGARIDVALLGRISHQLAPQRGEDDESAWSWRTGHSWVGGPTPDTAVLVHTPPGPHLPTAAAQWEAWARDDCELPLVGKIAMGHHQLEVIHPFAGGNGYVSRLYVSLELVRAKALRDQILPLSRWMDRHREEYHRRLREVVDTGSFEAFMMFFAEGVRELCGERIALIRRLEDLRADQLSKVKRSSGNAATVAGGLIGMPVSNHREIANRFGMTWKGANDVTRTLERAGLLTPLPGKNYNKIFLCQPVLDLLTTYDPVPPDTDRDVFKSEPE